MTFHIDNLKDKTKKEILKVWDIAQEHMIKQDERIKLLERVGGMFNASPELTFEDIKRLFKSELKTYKLEQQIKALSRLIEDNEIATCLSSNYSCNAIHISDVYQNIADIQFQIKELK